MSGVPDHFVQQLSAPGFDAAAVTPADGADLPKAARALYVGGAGDVCVVTLGGSTVTFPSVPAGSILPIACSRVKATGTGATNIVAFF